MDTIIEDNEEEENTYVLTTIGDGISCFENLFSLKKFKLRAVS